MWGPSVISWGGFSCPPPISPQYLDLLNVRLKLTTKMYQALFWLQIIFMSLIAIINFPLGQKLEQDYPFNNLMGKICSGNGVHKSNISPKDESLHLMLPAVTLIYIFFTYYLSRKTERFLTGISPKGSGALLNKQHR